MGSCRGLAKEPTLNGPAVATERRAECGDTAGTVPRKQRWCDCDGLQRDEQHHRILPGQA